MSGETKFSVLVSLFTWIQKSKSSAIKRSKFRKFLDTFCKPCDYFNAIRLILPSLDRERGTYGLKESVLATCLVDALGMARDSEDALRLFNWRRGGPKTGANAGNFALVATEVLQRRQGMVSGGLTIKELNELLDRLASSENRRYGAPSVGYESDINKNSSKNHHLGYEGLWACIKLARNSITTDIMYCIISWAEKTSVLSTLISKTNAQEMKWIVMIILKDLKLGISEKSIFHEFHPDAEDLFNVTCDLKLVCERLKDRGQRHKRQDIEVGKPVRPQLAMRIGNAAASWKKLHGKEVIVECKFDGDRIQIHKNGTEVHYFSRNFLDHSEYEHGMSDIIVQNILVDRCILDGEMLVWDNSLKRFAEFGSNQEIAKAAKEGFDNDRQLCYVAFDILYAGDTSVIHQSLKERHELLRKVVKPLKGRLEILVPDGGLNSHRRPGEPCWSLMVHSLDDVEKFFKETIENRDEGIVLKDLGSKWEPGDRSGKWLKLKPEYIRASSDLDVLIIGGYYGSGRHGGEVAQFLVGLAERPAPNVYPKRFISFCRVGTGLSDDELDAVVTKLKPYFRKYEYPKKAPPNFYQVTNHSKERPDVWVESPEKSLILAITSDIRTISSEVFAAPYSLRFPRIDRVRWDKPWHECLDVQSFVELVHSSNGTTQRTNEYKDQPTGNVKERKHSGNRRGDKKTFALVPSHFTQTDVSTVKGESQIFSDMMFYFVNVPPEFSLDSLRKMVVENGGTFSMNLNSSVTYCVAAESKGIKFQAAKRSKDVIHYSWVLDCCSQKKLLPLQPKHFLFLSDTSKKRLQEELDEFSDSYFWDLDLADIKQLLSNVKSSGDPRTLEHYKKKLSPREKWSLFHGCCIHFHSLPQTLGLEMDALLKLSQRTLELEFCWGGGKVSGDLANVTHLVVLAVPGLVDDSQALSDSLDVALKRLLKRKSVHIVRSKWLEDCLESGQKLPEDPYEMQIFSGTDDSMEEDRKHEVELESPGFLPLSPDKEEATAASQEGGATGPSKLIGRRKRGRPPSVSTKKGKMATNQTRRTRPPLLKKPPKISAYESEGSSSSGEAVHENMEVGDDAVHHGVGSEEITETVVDKTAEDVKDTREEGSSEASRVISEEKHDAGGSEENAPILEVMTDPVDAMLLDMIPSLRMKKVDPSANRASEDEKGIGGPSEEPVVKKKKVSYRDVAGELLKDW